MPETTEVKTKKNTDYSNSAVNLNNNEIVRIHLKNLNNLQDELMVVQRKINESIPAELTAEENRLQKEIESQTMKMKSWIDLEGSYQDLDAGWYAIKQRKVTKLYDALAFETNYPAYAPAIVIKALDITKLGGLVKGGLLSELDLIKSGVIEEKETYSYIIKVAEVKA